ncbi:hypothetical protein [Moorena producens]|nr:hypothetical protein [Moorena producens]
MRIFVPDSRLPTPYKRTRRTGDCSTGPESTGAATQSKLPAALLVLH